MKHHVGHSYEHRNKTYLMSFIIRKKGEIRKKGGFNLMEDSIGKLMGNTFIGQIICNLI
jgi:hypothetical protein